MNKKHTRLNFQFRIELGACVFNMNYYCYYHRINMYSLWSIPFAVGRVSLRTFTHFTNLSIDMHRRNGLLISYHKFRIKLMYLNLSTNCDTLICIVVVIINLYFYICLAISSLFFEFPVFNSKQLESKSFDQIIINLPIGIAFVHIHEWIKMFESRPQKKKWSIYYTDCNLLKP